MLHFSQKEPEIKHRTASPDFFQEHSEDAGSNLPGQAINSYSRKLKPAQILQLQRTQGNQAVLRLLAKQKASENKIKPQQTQVQRKILEHTNPVLDQKGVKTPVEGRAEALVAAKELSDEVDKAVGEVNFAVVSYDMGLMSAEDVLGFLETHVLTYHVDNFVNKLIDWKDTGGKKIGLLKAAAGYVIEGFADKVAEEKLHATQYVSGGARPDYRVITKKAYDYKGKMLPADALIDSTSAAEAAKGHISEKVTRMNRRDTKKHPHIFDVYYEDIGIGPASKTPIINSKLNQNRAKKYADVVSASKNRRKSLRPRTGGKVVNKRSYRYSPY